MNRRRVLAAASALAGGATAGCIGSPDGADGPPDELGVRGEEPTLAPGTATTLVVETTAVQRCQFTEFCGETDAVAFHLNDALLDPGPDGAMDSYPQIWTWEERRNVRIEVPIEVAADAPPGTCEYAVAVAHADGDETLERRFDVEVELGDALLR